VNESRKFVFELDAPISQSRSIATPPHCAAIDRGGRHGPRQDQDEIGCQSVQEPAGIKQKCYAPGTPTSKHHRTARQCWNNMLEGDIERFDAVMAHFITG
jgi:hypothetical protein